VAFSGRSPEAPGTLADVLIVRGTRKFLDRIGATTAEASAASTTALGDWYATALYWRPQVALFVNEITLLPVLVPLAPAATVVERFVAEAAQTFCAHQLDPAFVTDEVAQMMGEHRLATTASRSVVAVMNDFTRLAGAYRASEPTTDLQALAGGWLACRAVRCIAATSAPTASSPPAPPKQPDPTVREDGLSNTTAVAVTGCMIANTWVTPCWSRRARSRRASRVGAPRGGPW
jgi:hypothetical protein